MIGLARRGPGIDLNWRPRLELLGAEALESIGALLSHAALASSFSAGKKADWIAGQDGDSGPISAGLTPEACRWIVTTAQRPGLVGLGARPARWRLKSWRWSTATAPATLLAGLLASPCWIPRPAHCAKNTTANPDGVRQAMRFRECCGPGLRGGPAAIEPSPARKR